MTVTREDADGCWCDGKIWVKCCIVSPAAAAAAAVLAAEAASGTLGQSS
eukprot:CAMPEP_0168503256 /NCGR_PEP_ID=MMETSP0228-20121227/75765_1 /TAXON_ID=133427 /ORGANISM="Protoceratium reticulatum, Strain CCCM 535 (=CCMP 1889)" /LENGTH=48 /DNA_ID= /DNA_START= /DNA_END= /DNA_ORIENTATION=